ncbi:MAG: cysteine synthase family protein, partial [bacterium]|nr:cysteine synthase family protein [bacterium]
PDSVLDLIGNTPLLPLRHLVRPGMAQLYLKMEAFNPSGSLKDRIVKYIIDQAETEGSIRSEQIITDASSGNTGIAIGMVASLKGYRSRIYMPETKSIERRKIMRAWGTEVVLTTAEDQNSHIWAAQETAKDTEHFFYLDQNGNPGNWLAHYHGTGSEIVEQTGGRIDCFVAGAGTGGVLMGVARRLREAAISSRVVAIEPASPHSHIEGLLHFDGSFVPAIWDPDLIAEKIRVTDDDAFTTARRLARHEGLFCGPSTGAAIFVALREAERLGEGKTVVTVAGDRGERYLSTSLIPAQ